VTEFAKKAASVSESDAHVLDYDKLVTEYQASLTTVLRGFRAQQDGPSFLETWVPSEDDAESLVGLVDAAAQAGLGALKVRFGAASRARLGDASLQSIFERFSAPAWVEKDGALEVAIRLDEVATAGAHVAPRAAAAVPKKRAAVADAVQISPEATRGYDAALARVRIEHEGEPGTKPGAIVVVATAERGRIAALVDTTTHRVLEARHRGFSGATAAVAELLCARLERAPIWEGDHAAIRIEHALRGRAGGRPVPGIVSPENADPRLRAAAELARSLVRAFAEAAKADPPARYEWEPPPSDKWLALSGDERVSRVQRVLDDACAALGVARGDLACLRVDKDVRVILAAAPSIDPARKGTIVMDAEARLKDALDPALGVWLEEARDLNRIRRLAKNEGGHA
jgi:hypothetical protein